MMEQPRDNHKQECKDLASNPFVNLFQSPGRAAEYRAREHTCSDINQSTSTDTTDIPLKSTPTDSAFVVGSCTDQSYSQALSDLFQRIFLITVSADHERGTSIHKRRLPKRCVYLKKTASDAETNTPSILSWNNIDEALLERLAMTQPRSNVVIIGADHKRNLTAEVEAGEVNVVKYLYSCYRRACDEMKKAKDEDNQDLLEHVKKCTSLCVSYTGTTLLSPEMFPNQDPQKHIFSLLMSSQGDISVFEFMKSLIETHPSKDDLEVMFSASFSILAERSKSLTLQDADVPKILDVLSLFSKHKQVLELIVKSKWWLPPLPASLFNSGNTIISGRSFEKASILGPLLSLSCISADSSQPSQYFLRPADQNETEMQVVMKNLRSKIDAILDRMTGIVLDLLKSSPLTKHEILHWIGRCLHSNLGRKQMMAELFETTHAQDGFFLNLSLIMLKLCMPFMDPASPKLLKIDPCYCAVETSVNSISNEKTSVHVFGMETETRLTLLENEETGTTLKTTSSFGFVTEIFFMTHRCLQLGLWRVTEKYKKLMTELAKMQQVYQDASSQGAEGVLIERLKVQFENKIIRQLALKTHLLNPTLSELALKFYIITASWLNQVALAGDDFKEMMTFRDVTTGLPDEVPKGLVFVPEFIIDNMADYIIFLRHFDSEETLESAGHSLHHLVTFFVLYLGSRERVKNPHLRAKLAEALEAIIPNQKNNSGGLLRPSQVFHFHREHAFAQHKVAPKFLPVALLRLFVDIEFTGHSMQFEQKFGYRHHMYTVLKYLWGHDNYKDTILEVSKEVEHASMMSEPPLFMRFINLLINDAIFLLDEALQYMEQIKTLQQEKDDGNWESLDEEAKRQKLQDLQQASLMARSHNILANETVQSLAYITVDITKPFVTACMIERVAAMLNYFLAKLVGPKMGKLKVKNFEEFNFKPQQLVSDIVDIYLNLGRENNFCKAVANDERSYHPSLFSQAERVLRLIARSPDVRFRLNEIAQNIAEFAQKDKIEEQNMPEPPDEFLDPIMNTVMEDPVLLPTSGNIVDRRTIARHLLSDEKDPFSRASLSLDMVVPQNELKMRIQRWRQKLKSAENEQ